MKRCPSCGAIIKPSSVVMRGACPVCGVMLKREQFLESERGIPWRLITLVIVLLAVLVGLAYLIPYYLAL